MKSTMATINTNYNNLMPEPKTLPTPCGKEEQDKGTRHSLIKNFVKYLNKTLWQGAEDLYQKFLEEDRQKIEQLIYERNLKVRFEETIELKKVKIYVKNCFKILKSPGDPNYGYALRFIEQLLRPAVYKYLRETFEYEKTQRFEAIAKKTIEATQKKMFSPSNAPLNGTLMNYLSSELKSTDKELYKDFVQVTGGNLKNFRKLNEQFLRKQPKRDPFIKILYSAQMNHDNIKIGNCEEFADYSFLFLLKNGVSKVARAYLDDLDEFTDNSDHEFTILNKKNNDPNFMKWGRHCMVVDSHTGNSYPAYDIPLYLKDFKGVDAEGNPILEKFDPSFQTVKVDMTNIYSSSFLHKLFLTSTADSKAIKWFKSELEKFEKASSPKEKSKIAEEIISKAPKFQNIENKNVAKTIISQLNYFLNPNFAELYNVGPKNEKSVFEDFPITEQHLRYYVCSTTIDHLLKIAELYKAGLIERSDKKFLKLSCDLRNGIKAQFGKLTKGLSDEDSESPHLWVKAIHMYVIDKMATAVTNQKYTEACKIFAKLPEYVHEDIHLYVGEDVSSILRD
jgi:hypothetical protein